MRATLRLSLCCALALAAGCAISAPTAVEDDPAAASLRAARPLEHEVGRKQKRAHAYEIALAPVVIRYGAAALAPGPGAAMGPPPADAESPDTAASTGDAPAAAAPAEEPPTRAVTPVEDEKPGEEGGFSIVATDAARLQSRLGKVLGWANLFREVALIDGAEVGAAKNGAADLDRLCEAAEREGAEFVMLIEVVDNRVRYVGSIGFGCG
jgi:hypothetical protein